MRYSIEPKVIYIYIDMVLWSAMDSYLLLKT